MNMEGGGKAPQMRDGFYNDCSNGENNVIVQQMNWSNDHPVFSGAPKGLRQILSERGIIDFSVAIRLDCSSKTCITCKDIIQERQKLSKTILCNKTVILCSPRK